MPITPNTDSNFDKKLLHENVNYESSVGVVQLYPYGETIESTLEYPVISVSNTSGVNLEFDLLQENSEYINVRFIHCNYDWTKSNLSSIQFLDTYNEFTIRDYQFSQNTRIPYVHYSITLPTPTKSGNYIVMAYRDSNPSDILLSRKLLVFENSASISPKLFASSSIQQRNNNQQLELDVYIKELESINPFQDIKMMMVQNHNWETSIEGLQPTRIRRDKNLLQYEYFNGENEFPGWNEYRYFDLRSTEYRGMNVGNIVMDEDRIRAYVGLDKSRKGLAYTQYNNDLNGWYYLDNTDPNDIYMENEYVNTYFELITDQINGDVYIAGGFNNWQLDDNNKMHYDEATASYKGQVLLKQGYYNYAYWVSSEVLPITFFEGSHYQTINNYEFLIYLRKPGNLYDQLIGYKLISSGDQF